MFISTTFITSRVGHSGGRISPWRGWRLLSLDRASLGLLEAPAKGQLPAQDVERLSYIY